VETCKKPKGRKKGGKYLRVKFFKVACVIAHRKSSIEDGVESAYKECNFGKDD